MNREDQPCPQMFSVGTQVVILRPVLANDGLELRPAGSVALIVHAPMDAEHRYRLRFTDGETLMFARHDLEVFKHHKNSVLGANESAPDLFQHVIYRCIVGSRAFGLCEENSDLDLRGIFLPPAELQWSLTGVPDIIERPGVDECYWELERFLVLALKANPNILECLYTPLIDHSSEIAEELLEIRDCFLSQFLHKTYNGYVLSQFKKLQHSRTQKTGVNWKHAMHLIRLLLSGVEVMRSGTLQIDASSHRSTLLAIKHGEISWDAMESLRLELHRDFDAALKTTPLPERPDFERVNRFLIEARRQMVNRS